MKNLLEKKDGLEFPYNSVVYIDDLGMIEKEMYFHFVEKISKLKMIQLIIDNKMSCNRFSIRYNISKNTFSEVYNSI